MKTVVFERPTRDVDGLLLELRKLGPVVSVGSDQKRTYVYLEDFEGPEKQKDPAPVVKAWVDVPELRVEAMNASGADGVPIALADGKDLHTLVIQKITPGGEVVPDNTKLTLSTAQPVNISKRKFRLEEGLGSIMVGPSDKTGDVQVEVVDISGRMKPVQVQVRFVAPANKKVAKLEEAVKKAVDAKKPEKLKEPEKPKAASDKTPVEVKDQPGIWKKLKIMLGF